MLNTVTVLKMFDERNSRYNWVAILPHLLILKPRMRRDSRYAAELGILVSTLKIKDKNLIIKGLVICEVY